MGGKFTPEELMGMSHDQGGNTPEGRAAEAREAETEQAQIDSQSAD